jgi:hypothetical protein
MLPLLPDKRRDGFQRDGLPWAGQRMALAVAMSVLPFLLFVLELTACATGPRAQTIEPPPPAETSAEGP